MIRRAHVLHGYQLSEIATHLGMHPNSMSKVLRRLKDIRSETARVKPNRTCTLIIPSCDFRDLTLIIPNCDFRDLTLIIPKL